MDEGFPCRNVRIHNNTVSGRCIAIRGNAKDSGDLLIQGNKAVGKSHAEDGTYAIGNIANAKVEDNQGFARVDNSPWLSDQERRKREEEARKQKK